MEKGTYQLGAGTPPMEQVPWSCSSWKSRAGVWLEWPSCLCEGPRPSPGARQGWALGILWHSRKHFQQWQQLLLPRLRFPEDPKAFPIIFALFQKPLSHRPASTHARAEVHLAACSPVQPVPGLGSQGRKT